MEDFAKLLEKLGLSEAEARAYLRLVERADGELLDRAFELFELSEEEARDVLASLVHKGAASLERNRVKAAPPREFVHGLLESRRRELEKAYSEADRAASELLKNLEPIFWERRLGIKAEELLEPLEDLKAMEIRTTQIMSRAVREIAVLAGRFDWFPRVREVLAAAHDRKVKIRALLGTVEKANEAVVRDLKSLGAEVRKLRDEWYPIRGTLCDGGELVFLIWATRKDVKMPVHYRPSYTKNEGLVRIFMDAFERKWAESSGI